jgi:hypothetical protein
MGAPTLRPVMRKRVIAWLRDQADTLEHQHKELAPHYRARFWRIGKCRLRRSAVNVG